MCHFITATLPASVDPDKAAEIFARHKLRFEEIENDSVREYLDPGDLYILTTQGQCDCGTVLGSEYPESDIGNEEKERFRKQTIDKLRKKGWSRTKIDRWFKEAELKQEKEDRSKELQHQYAVTFVSDWIAFIEDLLRSKVTPRVGILLHNYSGPLSGRISLGGKKRTTLNELNEDVLLRMPEDVIHEFVAS